MEGLAFPSRPSRAAGPEEAGRRSMFDVPANPRTLEAGAEFCPAEKYGEETALKTRVGSEAVPDLVDKAREMKSIRPLRASFFSEPPPFQKSPESANLGGPKREKNVLGDTVESHRGR